MKKITFVMRFADKLISLLNFINLAIFINKGKILIKFYFRSISYFCSTTFKGLNGIYESLILKSFKFHSYE